MPHVRSTSSMRMTAMIVGMMERRYMRLQSTGYAITLLDPVVAPCGVAHIEAGLYGVATLSAILSA